MRECKERKKLQYKSMSKKLRQNRNLNHTNAYHQHICDLLHSNKKHLNIAPIPKTSIMLHCNECIIRALHVKIKSRTCQVKSQGQASSFVNIWLRKKWLCFNQIRNTYLYPQVAYISSLEVFLKTLKYTINDQFKSGKNFTIFVHILSKYRLILNIW